MKPNWALPSENLCTKEQESQWFNWNIMPYPAIHWTFIIECMYGDIASCFQRPAPREISAEVARVLGPISTILVSQTRKLTFSSIPGTLITTLALS